MLEFFTAVNGLNLQTLIVHNHLLIYDEYIELDLFFLTSTVAGKFL